MKLVHVCCLLALLVTPLAVRAQAVTYDFTGVVTDNVGYAGVTDGMTVTGTYTLNFANANPAQTTGVPGSMSASWMLQNSGGTDTGTSAPTLDQYMFTSTLELGSVSYATTVNGTYFNSSRVQANVTNPSAPFTSYTAEEQSSDDTGSSVTSSFFTFTSSATPPVAPWTSTGQPIFLTSNANVGGIQNGDSDLQYDITSFEPAGLSTVPLPAAAWLLLSGMGGLGLLARRHRAV